MSAAMPAGRVTIRPGEAADVDAVVALERESFPDPWSRNLLYEVVAGNVPSARVLVVEISGAVVGVAIASTVTDTAELQRVAVAGTHRRSGVASALLDAVVGLAEVDGCDRILLEVREANTGALAFYRARGFVALDRRERYYLDGAAAVVMERRL